MDKFTNQQAVYLYRSADFREADFVFNGSDFVGDNKGDIFANKLGAFISFAHIVLSVNKAALSNSDGAKSFLSRFEKQGIEDYKAITDAQAAEIDVYLKLFCL